MPPASPQPTLVSTERRPHTTFSLTTHHPTTTQQLGEVVFRLGKVQNNESTKQNKMQMRCETFAFQIITKGKCKPSTQLSKTLSTLIFLQKISH
jgi:hypothetical protein